MAGRRQGYEAPSGFGYGIESSWKPDHKRTVSTTRVAIVVRQLLIWIAIQASLVSVVAAYFLLVKDDALDRSLGLGCIYSATIMLTLGAFSLLGGGIATDTKFDLSWAGVPILRRGEQWAVVGGLTFFGVSLLTAPPFFIAAALLL